VLKEAKSIALLITQGDDSVQYLSVDKVVRKLSG